VIDLVFLDESEALTHPYLARCWARRGGPAISPRWLSHQLRQRGLPGAGRATPSKGARTQPRSRPAVSTSPI
jgi:hypothetical protein